MKADRSFTIRRAQTSDARAITAYLLALYAEPDSHMITRPAELRTGWFAARLRLARKLASAHETCLVAEAVDGSLVGMLESWTDTRRRVRHGTTLAMSVAKGWRCRGVGTALLAGFIDWVSAHPTLRRIELHVHADNEHAIALYRSFGFLLEGTRRRAILYEDGRVVDDHIMALWPRGQPQGEKMSDSDNKAGQVSGTKHKTAPAAKFLLVIAGVIVLILVGGIIFTANEDKMLKFAFVPAGAIDEEEFGATPDYAEEANWAARPGMDTMASWKPEGVVDIAQVPEVDIFYIHPTTYLNKATWNAPIDGDWDAVRRLNTFALKHQASAFNLAGQIYAPRYRQATFGAFFDTSGQGVKAIGRAHGDVLAAFDHYIQNDNKGRPFILVGHSQGSLHALIMLAERIAPTKLKNRMVAAYLIGWPVSMEGDLEALPGINACEGKTDTGCVVSYQSFASEGDAAPIIAAFNATPGLNGKPHAGTTMLCTNPLTWKVGGKAPRAANTGALALMAGEAPLQAPIPGLTGARCGEDGILYLTEAPGGDWRQYVMTGENYHAYDLNLFYMNIRENAAARAQAWLQANAE